MQENRKYARLEAGLPLSFERKGPGTLFKGKGITKNISPHGLCFLSPVALGVGEKLSVQLHLPTGETLVLEGRIKWSRSVSATSNEIGVEIAAVSIEEQNRYLLFVCDLMYDRLRSLQLLG